MIRAPRLAVAAAYGLTAVLLGAIGTHRLQGYLSPGQIHGWETAVFYQFFHTLVLLFLSRESDRFRLAFLSFSLGILLFSGSLYLWTLTDYRWLMYVTPFGGLAFLVGWSHLLWLSLRPAEDSPR